MNTQSMRLNFDDRVIHIDWQDTPQLWMATFNNYDGAPDSHHPMGLGKTRWAAIEELIEQEAA